MKFPELMFKKSLKEKRNWVRNGPRSAIQGLIKQIKDIIPVESLELTLSKLSET